MKKILILDVRDNIAVCLAGLAEGDLIQQDDITITVKNLIPLGHKIAIKEISESGGIIKYGERMGHAITAISIGEHVHIHNILGDRLSTDQP